MLERLTPEELGALVRFRDDQYPTHTLNSVAHKLLRDALIGCGVLPLGKANRSRHAGR